MQFFIAIGVIAGVLLAVWSVQALLSKGADVATRQIGKQIDKQNEKEGLPKVTMQSILADQKVQEARIEKQRRARLARQNRGTS